MDKKLNRSNTPARRYPALYERIIPIAIGLIVVILVVLLVITFGVAFGVWASPA